VKKVDSPFAAGNADQISKDRNTALVTLELRTTDLAKAKTLDAPVEKAIIAGAARHPGSRSKSSASTPRSSSTERS
jgi:hypothetical protein